MNGQSNSLNWFEIPVADLNRAKTFYEAIFGVEMTPPQEAMGITMVCFPWTPGSGKANGALAHGEWYKPSMEGNIIYLNANPGIQPVLDRIQPAGGKILVDKTPLGEGMGYWAIFVDSEGNRMGLHAQN